MPAPGVPDIKSIASLVSWVVIRPSVTGAAAAKPAESRIKIKPAINGGKYGLKKDGYYLVVGRFVPENNYETMITEFMRSNTKRNLAIITNVKKDKFYMELKEKTRFEEDKRIKFLNLRKRLQHKGTLSAKRLLRKLSGRENRWMRNVNFCAIKAIINFAKENNVSYIGIEDLTNIRNSSKKLSKNIRRTINSWAFYQFKEILCYKTKMNRMSVIPVDPRFTSQACSKCGYVNKENRKSQKCFKCLSCGYTHNADINAASNIELLIRIIRSNELSRGDINHPDAKDVDSKGLFRQLRTSLTCKLTSLSSE